MVQVFVFLFVFIINFLVFGHIEFFNLVDFRGSLQLVWLPGLGLTYLLAVKFFVKLLFLIFKLLNQVLLLLVPLDSSFNEGVVLEVHPL